MPMILAGLLAVLVAMGMHGRALARDACLMLSGEPDQVAESSFDLLHHSIVDAFTRYEYIFYVE